MRFGVLAGPETGWFGELLFDRVGTRGRHVLHGVSFHPCRRWARLSTARLCLSRGAGSCTGGSGRLQVLWQDDAKRAGGVAHGLVGWWVGRLAEDGDRGPGTSCRLRRRHRRRHLGRRSLGPRLDTDAAAELLILATACTRVLDCGGAGGLGRPRRGCPGGVWPR